MNREFTPNIVLVNNKPVYFFESDSQSDEAIVFLHGFMSDYRSIEPFAANLKTSAHMVLPDLPGFGASPIIDEEVSLQDYAEWLNDFINETCRGKKKITIVGYSFGAYIAILFASMYKSKVDELVLVTPVIKIAWPVRIYGKWFDSLTSISEFVANKLYTWRPQYDFTTHYLRKAPHPELKNKLLSHRRTELEYLNPELVLKLFREFKELDIYQYIDDLDMPSTIIIASKDNVADNKETRQFVEEMSVRPVVCELEKAGHLVPFEEPELLAMAVDKARGESTDNKS